MKVLLLLALVAIATTEIVHDGEIFDMFDFIEILKDDVKRNLVLQCVTKKGECGEYQVVRDRGPNILKTRCEDCTAAQKEKFEESIKKFEAEHPEEYVEMIARIAPPK